MLAPAFSLVSFRRLVRRFRRNRDAASALEFAIIAPIFLGLLFAILETALMFFAAQVLETITTSSARMILTGQAQNGSYTAANFQTYVCGQIPALFNCSSLKINVQNYSSSSSITFPTLIDGSGNFVGPTNYSPGGPGDYVLVQVSYPWQLFVTGLGYNIANLANSQRLLTAASAFKNEPY